MRLDAPPAALPAGLLLVATAGLALGGFPPDGSSARAAGLAAAFAAAGLAAGVLLAVATKLDPEHPLSLRADTARFLVGVLVVASIAAALPGAAFVAAILAGWLHVRDSRHASDALLLGTLFYVAVLSVRHAEALDRGLAFLVPLALASLALLLREAFDLSAIVRRIRADTQPRAEAGSRDRSPDPRREAAAALLVDASLLAAFVAAAALVGVFRAPIAAAAAALLGEAPLLALAGFLASLVGGLFVLRQAKA